MHRSDAASLTLFAFALLAPPSFGSAQSPAAAPAPEDTTKTVAEAPAPQAVDAQLERAAPLIARAEGLYEASNYGAALAEFERAYELLEGHPDRFEALYNIALCEQRLFRYDRAMRSFRRYLDEAGTKAPDRAAVEAAIETLEGLLGTLRIEVSTQAEVWIDDRWVGQAPGELLVPSGTHSLELRAPGYEPEKREVSLAARASRTLRFSLRPSGSRGLSPAYFWLACGAAIAAAGTGAVFGLNALSEAEDIDRRERDERAKLILRESDGDVPGRAALSADLLFGAAGLLAASSVVLYFLTDWGGEPESAEISVSAGPEHGLVALRGQL